MYPRPRPQRKQRLVARDGNFGVFLDLAMTDAFAIDNKKASLKRGLQLITRKWLVNYDLWLFWLKTWALQFFVKTD